MMKIIRNQSYINRPMTHYKTLSLAVAVGFACLSQPALSGGFQLSDQSVTSLGRAHAGYGVFGDDASAAHFNPAGMSLLKQRQFQVGGAYSDVEGEYTPNNALSSAPNQGAGDDGAQSGVVPNIYLILPINSRINFGLGITTPYGTNTDYDADFAGRFSGRETRLTTIDINPSLSFKINDFISLGAGISYQKLDATLSAAVSPAAPDSNLRIKGDSEEFGYNVGVMVNFSDDSRLGISYRSEIDHDIEGSANFTGLGPADGRFPASANFASPATAYFGYVKPISDKWTLSLGARWTEWSVFEGLTVDFPEALAAQSTTLDTNWNNSWTTMIGADYKLNSKWTLRAGYGDDQTPALEATRSVRTVNSDRKWYSIGSSYIVSDKLQFDFAYRYITFDKARVNRTTGPDGDFGSIVGSFDDINIHTFAIQANYKF